MANTKGAAKVLVFDGCNEECARKMLELAGFKGFAHLQLERNLGFEKGATRVTAARIRQIADRGGAVARELTLGCSRIPRTPSIAKRK